MSIEFIAPEDAILRQAKDSRETVNETVLDVLRSNPQATYKIISGVTDFSRAKVGRSLQSTKEGGVIERVGSAKKGL